MTVAATVFARSAVALVVAGASVGLLGGLIGHGGAEFRLPLLIGVFTFGALSAVILNKAMSLIVVVTALPVRLAVIPYAELAPLERGGESARRELARRMDGCNGSDPDA